MSLLQDQRAHIALNRFGLGAKPGAIGRIRANAKAAILAELDTPDIALINRPDLPTYEEACRAVHRDFVTEEGIKERELTARILKHLQPEIGFVERLVLFFSNHFSMSVNKDDAIRATIGQLEREVIRKHVLGSFKAMLIGVMRHPAMLAYLDNDDSIGPNSVIGKSWGVGLNQNLAREILELHTLGVGGGYTENDVDGLASALTGWSFVRGWEAEGRYNGGHPGNRGQFIFRADWHEPGAQTVLGQSYPNTGINQAVAVLTALAQHPSTAQFLAFKLVRHFITDKPTPDLVNPVASAYRNSGGNLKAVARALIDLPLAWEMPLQKLRTPYELQIAEMRALNRVYDPKERWPFSEPLYALRHAPWQRPAPDGYPDETAYWMGPDAMRVRLETAQLNAWTLQQVRPVQRTAVNLATSLFGPVLSGPSRQAIADAASLDDGLTMVFMVPEFQRR
jgi:uncharacterized protein (DUF1800 family)